MVMVGILGIGVAALLTPEVSQVDLEPEVVLPEHDLRGLGEPLRQRHVQAEEDRRRAHWADFETLGGI